MVRKLFQILLLGMGAVVIESAVHAVPPQNGDNISHAGQRPVYQRRAFDGRTNDYDRRRGNYWQQTPWMTPQVSAGSFQRPYPYHLDYYKMRYGGSYAPYYGNLYGTPFGTPQVVNEGWGPGAGGWGPDANGYPLQGPGWPVGEYGADVPSGPSNAPIQEPKVVNPPKEQSTQESENLPNPGE